MMTLKRVYLLLSLLLMGMAVYPPTFIDLFELRFYDLLARYTAPATPDPRIVIVGIDQRSLDLYGRWPWDRKIIGDLILKMKEFDVKVTALDVVFGGETDPENDHALAASIAKAGNVVTGYNFHYQGEESATLELTRSKRESLDPFRVKLVSRDDESVGARVNFPVIGEASPNIPVVQAAGASSGFFNVWPSLDGIIRAQPLIIDSEGDLFPSMDVASAALYEGNLDGLTAYFEYDVFAGFTMGERFIQTDPSGLAMIRFLGGDETFPIISAAEVMQGDPATDVELRERLAGKIALVGATATTIYDLRVTPLGYTAGVEIHANAIANLLSGEFVQKLGWQNVYDALVVAMLAIILYVFLTRVNVVAGVIGALTVGGAGFGANAYIFGEHHLWLNTVTPLLTILVLYTTVTVARVIEEQRNRRFITGAFGHYLSPKLINEIIEHPERLKLGGEKREITAFFSDIAGFTTISEKLSAPQLSALLNDYLTEMTDIIQEQDGTVDKFIGDAVVAMWGAPVAQDDHAYRTVRAAVTQQRKLAIMREYWRAHGKEELFVRMGVNTGVASVGNMGSRSRFDYTMLGDTVNLAARLEGANKYYGSDILISEFTYDLVKDQFFCRELDRVRVQGKKDAIRLYEVIDEMGSVNDAHRRFTQTWRMALALFYQMRFEKAARLFAACDRLKREGDGACKLYLKRCAELAARAAGRLGPGLRSRQIESGLHPSRPAWGGSRPDRYREARRAGAPAPKSLSEKVGFSLALHFRTGIIDESRMSGNVFSTYHPRRKQNYVTRDPTGPPVHRHRRHAGPVDERNLPVRLQREMGCPVLLPPRLHLCLPHRDHRSFRRQRRIRETGRSGSRLLRRQPVLPPVVDADPSQQRRFGRHETPPHRRPDQIDRFRLRRASSRRHDPARSLRHRPRPERSDRDRQRPRHRPERF